MGGKEGVRESKGRLSKDGEGGRKEGGGKEGGQKEGGGKEGGAGKLNEEDQMLTLESDMTSTSPTSSG